MEYRDFIIKIAEMKVRMLCSHPYTAHLCGDFLSDAEDADITVSVSDSEIESERGNYAQGAFSDGYCEGICLYRAIAEKMPQFGGFVFHGAAVDICGRGVIFAAPSGVGKSTHISLLMQRYPEAVRIINGDKPIIRRADGEWRVYSAPWAGKEGLRANTHRPLHAIVLLERSETNFIKEAAPETCFDGLIRQVYIPKGGEGQMLTFELVDDMAAHVKFYRMGCNISKEAAEVSYGALCK